MKKSQQGVINAVFSVFFALGVSVLISLLSDTLKSKALSTAVLSEQERNKPVVLVDPNTNPNMHAVQAKKDEIELRFNQAVLMLHSKQYEYAIKSLHRVLELAPRMPEAHVNMGFAFLGGGDAKAARDFFTSALELNQQQLNAYYGLAVAAEAMGDMEIALGAMRTYVHLSPTDSPYLAKARAALWEWQDARANKAKMDQEKPQASSEK